MKSQEQQFKEAISQINSKNFEAAEKIFTNLVDQGNIHAQINLATLYLDPNAGLNKHAKAYELLLDAVNKEGGVDATNSLGMMHMAGLHVQQDYLEAEKWFQVGADNEIPACFINLGKMKFSGVTNNNKPDIQSAISYFIQAFRIGYPDGLNETSSLISRLNTPKLPKQLFDNLIKSTETTCLNEFKIVDSQGDGEDEYLIAEMFDQITGFHSCKKTTYDWYIKSHNKQLAKATNNIGAMHLKGEFVDQNFNEAIKYFKIASEKNDSFAMKNLGACYIEGIGTNIDFEMAKYWLQKSVDGGCKEAIPCLAFALYMNSPTQPNQYIELMEKACAMNHPECLVLLGRIYLEGDNVKQDIERGLSLLKRASFMGHNAASLLVGVHLVNLDDSSKFNDAAKHLLLAIKDSDSTDIIGLVAEIFYDQRNQEAFDTNEAIRLNKILADKGDPIFQARLAKLYIGYDIKTANLELASKYAKLSSAQGNTHGSCTLITLFSINYLTDTALLHKTLDQLEADGSGLALFTIGHLYETGCKHITMDAQASAEYYSRAASQGYELAIDKMKALFKN